MSFKFNPLTGNLDLVENDNFSHNNIPSGETVSIPENQQMLVYKNLVIDGDLVINGDLVIFDTKVINRIKTTSIAETIDTELYELITQDTSGITTSLSSVIGSTITITNRSGGANTLNIAIQGSSLPIIKDGESFSLIYNGIDYDFT